MELALEAGVSTRHVSFLETGRAKPSRAMVLQLADALMMPRSAHNALLQQAGFTHLYPTTPLESELIAPLQNALSLMMEKHSPWPAILCDRHWNIIRANPTADTLISALRGPTSHINMVKMLVSNPIARDAIVNFDEVRHELLGRVRLEALEAGNDPYLRELEEEIRASILATPHESDRPRRPLVPFIMRAGDMQLSFLTAFAHFGTSDDIAVRDLRLEMFFPADNITTAFFNA